MAPVPLVVCPADGFVFYKDQFTEEELRALKPFVFSEEFRELKDESVHFRAAWLEQKVGEPAKTIVGSLRSATWEAKTHASYARYASALLEILPTAIAEESNFREKAGLRLLQGEILRRLGKFDDAKERFTAFLNDLGDADEQGVIAHLELDMVANGNDRDAVIPRDAFEKAKGTPSWMAARTPLRSSQTRFGRVIGQIPTTGFGGYIWDGKSRFLAAQQPDLRRLAIISIDSKISDPIELPHYARVNLLSGLPNGNILLSAAVQGGYPPREHEFRLLELSPETSDVVADAELPELVYSDFFMSTIGHPMPISFDRSFVILGAGSAGLLRYDIKRRIVDNLTAPPNVQSVVAMDLTKPWFLAIISRQLHDLPNVRKVENLLIGDYNESKSILSLPCREDDFGCNFVDARIDGVHKILHVMRSMLPGGQCELLSYEIGSGKLIARSERRLSAGRAAACAVSISNDARYVAVRLGSSVEILDPKPPFRVMETLVAPLDYGFDHVDFSPDSKYLAMEVDGVITVLGADS